MHGWIPIEKIEYNEMPITFNIKTHHFDMPFGCKPQKYINPFEYNLKITLRNGLSIITTPNHKWLIKRYSPYGYGFDLKYIQARNLKNTDIAVIVQPKIKEIGIPTSPALARILGFIVGDGHLTKRYYPNKWGTHNRIQLTNSDKKIIERFKLDISHEFNEKIHWIQNKNKHDVEGYNGTTVQTYFHNKKIYEQLNLHVKNKNKASSVRIPDIIKHGDIKTKQEFIKALFSSDATISKKGWKNKNYHIALSTVSKKLANDVMLILMELGFTPYLNNYNPPDMKEGYKRKRRYWVSIFKRNELKAFSNQIGFIGAKQNKLKIAVKNLSQRMKNKNNWNNSKGINPFRIKKIQKIKASKYVYDIETEKNHNYICRNIILHNSFREEMSIQDIQNILAKKCIHTIWIYPTDFIARNSVYGFETYGKDLKNKLIRLIVYDLRKSMFGMFTPLGYMVVPKLQDPKYQHVPEKDWSEYRKKNKGLGRQDFDSLIEEQYEIKKDEWLGKEQRGEQGIIHKQRFEMGAWLGQQKLFQEAKNKKRQAVIAQNMFPQFTTAELADIVEIARMGVDYSEIEKLAAKRRDDENGEETKVVKKKEVKNGKKTRLQKVRLSKKRRVRSKNRKPR